MKGKWGKGRNRVESISTNTQILFLVFACLTPGLSSARKRNFVNSASGKSPLIYRVLLSNWKRDASGRTALDECSLWTACGVEPPARACICVCTCVSVCIYVHTRSNIDGMKIDFTKRKEREIEIIRGKSSSNDIKRTLIKIQPSLPFGGKRKDHHNSLDAKSSCSRLPPPPVSKVNKREL